LQILLVYYATRWSVYKKIVTSNYINSTVCRIRLVQDEKAQPDSYIRRTALQGALLIFEKINGF